MFLIFVSDLEEYEIYKMMLDDHPLLHEYANGFLDEILGMPPQCNIDFWIDLVLEVELVS